MVGALQRVNSCGSGTHLSEGSMLETTTVPEAIPILAAIFMLDVTAMLITMLLGATLTFKIDSNVGSGTNVESAQGDST